MGRNFAVLKDIFTIKNLIGKFILKHALNFCNLATDKDNLRHIITWESRDRKIDNVIFSIRDSATSSLSD